MITVTRDGSSPDERSRLAFSSRPEDIPTPSAPYRLASRAAYPEKTVVRVGDELIGSGRPVVIAGPCSVESETQIIPIFVGPADATMEFSRELLEHGLFVQGIRPPTVPAGSCRLRCTIMATHDPADLVRAAEAIETVGRRLGVI